MRSSFEFGGFLVLAAALHGGLAMLGSTEGGVQSAGVGGTDVMSLTASSDSVAAMVATWEAPPVTSVAPMMEMAMMAPAPMPEAPDMPTVSAPDLPSVGVALPTPKLEAPLHDMPQVDQTAPEPAPQMTSLRPPQRPEPPVRPKPVKEQPKEKPRKQEHKQATKAAVASSASAGAKAAGSGGDVAAGNNGAANVATLSPARERNLLAEWGASIRARIARNVPRGAGKGTATVRVMVGADGRLQGVVLASSSGNDRIDQLALLAVERAGKFPPAPKGLAAKTQSFKLAVESR